MHQSKMTKDMYPGMSYNTLRRSMCRESALDFLMTGFPEHEVPFLRDMLAELGGDANAVTTKLLDMRADAEAHRLATEMEDLRPAPGQVRLSCTNFGV